jgi:uncharacterized membrane protein
MKSNTGNVTQIESLISDQENQAIFYKPIDVLNLIKWIEWGEKVAIVVIILRNLVELPGTANIIKSYYYEEPNIFIVYLLSLILALLSILFGIAITLVLLRTMKYVLRMIMEMEFTSRKNLIK